jgi:glutamine phosphoribosylpyrophosphate amidotransferase
MCGIAGIAGFGPASLNLYESLCLLQHRGQDAAGMATYSEGRMFFHKAKGLARDVLPQLLWSNLSVPWASAMCATLRLAVIPHLKPSRST